MAAMEFLLLAPVAPDRPGRDAELLHLAVRNAPVTLCAVPLDGLVPVGTTMTRPEPTLPLCWTCRQTATV
jgi:hypothetical protein